MPKWTSAELPRMDGRTVVITGAGSGIGLIAARELARVGATVVAAVRDPAKAAQALADTTGEVQIRRLDVSDLASIRAFVDATDTAVDVLVNNAGVMDIPAQRTADGLDLQTATNYFGPFVLTNLLADRITDRVVSVTSQLHRMARLDLADLDWRTRTYNPMQAYRDSKLALVLFSLELQRRLTAAGSPVRSVLAHPGIATTTLAAHSAANRVNRLRFLLNDPERGALPTRYAATQDVPGNAYVGPDGLGSIKGHPVVRRPGKRGLDPELARQLWAATAALTGVSVRPLRSGVVASRTLDRQEHNDALPGSVRSPGAVRAPRLRGAPG
jgi:NAD(P)-dependent dehydrogenase (short-subunit alcohol dehydrogenase family)